MIVHYYIYSVEQNLHNSVIFVAAEGFLWWLISLFILAFPRVY